MSGADLRGLAAYDQARHSEREDLARCQCGKEIPRLARRSPRGQAVIPAETADRPRRVCDLCGHPIREGASFTAGPMVYRHTTRCPEGP